MAHRSVSELLVIHQHEQSNSMRTKASDLQINAHRHVSVIIPMHNCAESLGGLFAALEAQEMDPDRFDVLLVDNGSDDETLERSRTWVRRTTLSAQVLSENSKIGSYAARNRGIRAAAGEILAFTDADCIPDPQWLSRGCAALSRVGQQTVIGGRVDLFLTGDRQAESANAVEFYELIFAFQREISIFTRPAFQTANLVVSRAAIDAVGLFDDDLLSGGDFEWCWRAENRGFQMVAEDKCVVRHPARSSLRALIRKSRRVAGGTAALRRKGIEKPRKRGLPQIREQLVATKALLHDARIRSPSMRAAVLGVALLVQLSKAAEQLNQRISSARSYR